MRSLVYLVACTLDGYIADVGGGFDFFPVEGPQVADLLAEFPEMIPGHFREPLHITAENQRFDTVLMGRATYEIGQVAGITSPYPHLRQILVSSSTSSPPDVRVEVITDDVAAQVQALKAEPGKDIWLCGGGRLAASLVDEIDELILKMHPIMLGSGIPLFAGPVGPRTAAMTEHNIYPNGFALLRYRWSR
ncbi:MAG: dihydrofolate reductase family protein [Pseudonocardiaceae bacterium]